MSQTFRDREEDARIEPIGPDDFDSMDDYEDFVDAAAVRETEESDRWPS